MREQAVISKGIDWLIVWMYAIFVIIGLLCIFSVEYHNSENVWNNIIGLKKNYARQLLFIAISGIIAVFILLTDSKLYTATANLSYAFGVLLMMATFVLGKDINGSRSWIPLGFLNLQPVET
jgi:rod shape determining protein RodA